jgi:hypothetical protein
MALPSALTLTALTRVEFVQQPHITKRAAVKSSTEPKLYLSASPALRAKLKSNTRSGGGGCRGLMR